MNYIEIKIGTATVRMEEEVDFPWSENTEPGNLGLTRVEAFANKLYDALIALHETHFSDIHVLLAELISEHSMRENVGDKPPPELEAWERLVTAANDLCEAFERRSEPEGGKIE